MNIIFDEYKYALQLLDNGFSNFMNFNDLRILAKYYRYLGLKDVQTRKELIDFCKKFGDYNEVINGNTLDKIVKITKNKELKFSKDIIIYKNEIDKIRSLGNYNYEKILFLMLVISRFNKYQENSEDYYLNTKISKIFSMAKVYTSKSERDEIRNGFNNLGLITYKEPNVFTRYKNTEYYQLFYADNTSASMILVNDLNNIVSFYNPICPNCGKEIEKKKSCKMLFCEECYKNKRLCDKRNWWNITRQQI